MTANGFRIDIDDPQLGLDADIAESIEELLERRFPPHLRSYLEALADSKISETLNRAGGGRIGRQLAEMADRMAAEQVIAMSVGEAGPAEQMAYESLEQFATKFLLKLFARNLYSDAYRWCPDWWKHMEAQFALEALWRSFEFYRHDGKTGVANWLLHVAYPIMRLLMDPDGVFTFCHAMKGHFHDGDKTEWLPHTPMPPTHPDSVGFAARMAAHGGPGPVQP